LTEERDMRSTLNEILITLGIVSYRIVLWCAMLALGIIVAMFKTR